MANITLSNQAKVNGFYNTEPMELESNILETTLVSGLTVVKSADQEIWVSGELTYTVTVTNDAEAHFSAPTFTDILDITQIKLVADSVEVNGNPTTYTYNSATGLLTVILSTITTETSTIITFKVERI